MQSARYPGRILICDRGTVDGGAYWPDSPEDFFASVGSSIEAELERYDAVIFFETAADGDVRIQGNNPHRTEDGDQARDLDRRLRQLWMRHPRFVLVPHNPSFFKKIISGLASIESIVAQLESIAHESQGSAPPDGQGS